MYTYVYKVPTIAEYLYLINFKLQMDHYLAWNNYVNHILPFPSVTCDINFISVPLFMGIFGMVSPSDAFDGTGRQHLIICAINLFAYSSVLVVTFCMSFV